ncbi:MAG: hypothetical protein HJJLKODD_00402 [Phycisphaerae bacterium]|nr:hypothetical protein [Phycisphaerae bacterium]
MWIMSNQNRAIPIFPLPNCVLLPGSLQCLHIFEPRYRAMIMDELHHPAEQRWIAMALLQEGFEPKYCSHQAPIHPMLCLGRIMRHEQLPDGRYNILLQGVSRVRILEEQYDRSYRRALLETVETPPLLDALPRRQSHDLLQKAIAQLNGDCRQQADNIMTSVGELEQQVDLLSNCLLRSDCPLAKQMVLEEIDPVRRVQTFISLLQKQAANQPAHERANRPECDSNN